MPLLKNHPLLASTDLDQVREVTGKLWAKHEVALNGRKPFKTLVNCFQATDISLSYVDCPTPLRVACASASGQYMVHLNLGGGAEHRINGNPEISDRGRAVIFGPRQDLVMVARPTRALILGLSQEWLEKALVSRGLPESSSPRWISGFNTRTGRGHALRRLCLQTARDLDNPASLLRNPPFFAHVESRLRQLLLDCLQESAPGGEQRPPIDPGLGRLMTLEGWMAEHLHLPLGIDELAGQVGLSPRAVQLAFRQHRGVTPLEFLRTLRLDEARKRLASGTGLSVAEVAGSLGFTHLGRFAGHYKQRFGESPAQTLRRHAGP
jgi:AraC-like DNA-binding protein